MTSTKLRQFLAFVLLLAVLPACDSTNQDGGTGYADIVDMRIDDTLIRTGEKTLMAVDFSYAANAVMSDGDRVIVAVKLPKEVDFEDGTSEIDGMFADRKVAPQTKLCAKTGDLYLIFDMDWNDLVGASNPDGDADARLTMTLTGLKSAATVTIEAAARNSFLSISCDSVFIPDMQAQMSIL